MIFLDLAAHPAERKTLPGHFHACNGELLADLGLFSKVNLAKVNLGKKIKTKGKIGIYLKSLHNLRIIKFNKHLFVIKSGITVVAVVTDPALSVRGRCKNLPHLKHQSFLPFISPHGASAHRADFFIFFLANQFLVGTIVTETPGFNI